MIGRAEHSPFPLRTTKAIRLCRIASNAEELPDGIFGARHRKITIESAQGAKHIVVDKLEGDDTIWRTTVDISSYEDHEVPFITASQVGIYLGHTVTGREYSAAMTIENGLGLYEVARAVRVAGRVCIEQNMLTEIA